MFRLKLFGDQSSGGRKGGRKKGSNNGSRQNTQTQQTPKVNTVPENTAAASEVVSEVKPKSKPKNIMHNHRFVDTKKTDWGLAKRGYYRVARKIKKNPNTTWLVGGLATGATVAAGLGYAGKKLYDAEQKEKQQRESNKAVRDQILGNSGSTSNTTKTKKNNPDA